MRFLVLNIPIILKLGNLIILKIIDFLIWQHCQTILDLAQ